MVDVIELGDRRKGKDEPPPAALYVCECGTTSFQMWTDGLIECANCRAEIGGTFVPDDPDDR